MTSPLPLVSIAIPCFNHESYIEEALESCVAQTYPNIEVVVVDDASTDGSRAVIDKCVKRHSGKIRTAANPQNLGPSITAQRAVAMTRGNYIAGMGSDDISLPHRIATGMDLLLSNPTLGAAFSKVQVIDSDGSIIDSPIKAQFNAPIDNLRWRLLSGNCLCGPSVLARAELIRGNKPNPSLRYVEDFDQWLRILDTHDIHRDNDIWIKYRQHGNNLSIFTAETAPIAPHYETAVCIIRAMQRWPMEKIFALRTAEGTNERRKELAQCHARLAEHCLQMDASCFKRPFLYTNEAYRQLTIAAELDPDNELTNRLLSEAWRRLGDPGRATGEKPTTMRQWFSAVESTLAPNAPSPIDSRAVAFRKWQEKTALRDIDGEHLARRMHRQWFQKPRFVVFVDGNEDALIENTMHSLQSQLYGEWIAVAMGNPSGADDRFVRRQNPVIPTATIAELQRDGMEDWLLFVSAGHELEPHALLMLADAINLHPQWQAAYADDASKAGIPRAKPDFDPVLLAGCNYLGPLAFMAPAFCALAADLPLSAGLPLALAWQIVENCGEQSIGHVSDFIFVAPDLCNIDDAAITRACVDAYFRSRDKTVRQIDGPTRDTNWNLAENTPLPPITLVSIGTPPTSLQGGTDYPHLRLATRSVSNPTALAEALCQSDTDLILISSGDYAPLTREWLRILASTLISWDTAAAGPAIIGAEGRLENTGLVLGMGGSLGGALPGTKYGDTGDILNRALLPHRVSALDPSCLLVSRAALEAAGGIDTSYSTISGALGDLCLRLHASGRTMIWTPLAHLQRARASEAGGHEDPGPFVSRWLEKLAADPYWNRHLSLQDGKGLIETDIAPRWHPGRRDTLRILALPMAPSGQAEYRVTAPLRALDNAGQAQTLLACVPAQDKERAPTPPEIARIAPDVLYAQAIVDDVRLQGYIACARHNPDVFRIFALDDRISDIPKYNDSHRALPQRIVVERMATALAYSDRLIVSTQPLADLYADHIDDIRVVPNRLEKSLWENIPPAPSQPLSRGKPRVGWAGALQHAGDLAIIAPVLEALAQEVDWVFFGMIPAGCERFVAEFHPPVKPYAAYPAKLGSLALDLALAPLEINPFNEAKSNLRLLEYGFFGWPVIASDIYPYRENGAPVHRIDNHPGAWIAAIRERLSDRPALRREGECLRTWVRTHYMLEDHLGEWLDALTPTPSEQRRAAPTPLVDIVDREHNRTEIQGGWSPTTAVGKPRILAYSQTTLLHDYRAASPLRALREAGMAETILFGRLGSNMVSCLTPEEAERLSPTATYWNFIIDDLRIDHGLRRYAQLFPDLPRIYGIDDRIGDLPPTHPLATSFPGSILDRRVREALALSSHLIVSTKPLAELYAPLVPSVCIVPNRLELALWKGIAPRSRDRFSRRPRVGWAGAQQHGGDLAILRDTVRELAGEVDWVFFGMVPAGCEMHVREYHPAVTFAEYPAKLANLDLDIALAPLEINLFNEAKSNLRLLDYGYLGWPVICSDIFPYREGSPPVFRVSNTAAAWTTAIRELAADPDARREAGEALHQWVVANYLLEDNLADWAAALAP